MATKNRSRGRCIGRRQKKHKAKPPAVANWDAGLSLLNKLGLQKTPVDRVDAKACLENLRCALDAMVKGCGTLDNAALIIAELNIANELCAMNFAGSMAFMPVVVVASEAMKDAGERSHRINGRWALSGQGLQAIRDLIELREEQLLHESNTMGLESAAYERAMAKVRAGNAFQIVVGDGVAA
jgi:hypothetical protein